jgi:hypothetical protein
MSKTWKWNPRCDLDLWQRCLFIVAVSWAFSQLTSPILPAFTVVLADILTIFALVAAVAKSSIQYQPKGKAVLVTGKYLTSNQIYWESML